MNNYRVKDWDEHFENNRSRKMIKMQWVPVPNKHDGEGFAHIMSLKDGMAIYGAWHLILQVASKCEPRGSLVRGSGEPHTAATIAMKTRGDAKTIEKALEICSSPEVAWLEELTQSGMKVAGDCQEGATEGKGIEGKEEKGSCGGKKGKYPINEDEFWDELTKIYFWVDIEAEKSKMNGWFLTPKGRGRKLTRGFAVNWLNKIDKPVSAKPPPHSGPKTFPATPDGEFKRRVAELTQQQLHTNMTDDECMKKMAALKKEFNKE